MRTFNQAGCALPRDASACDSATAQQSSVPALGPRPAVSQVPDTQTKTSESFSQDTPAPPSTTISISVPHTSLPLTNCLCFPSSLLLSLSLCPCLSVCHFRTLLAATAHPCSTKRETVRGGGSEKHSKPEANSLERH